MCLLTLESVIENFWRRGSPPLWELTIYNCISWFPLQNSLLPGIFKIDCFSILAKNVCLIKCLQSFIFKWSFLLTELVLPNRLIHILATPIIHQGSIVCYNFGRELENVPFISDGIHQYYGEMPYHTEWTKVFPR